MSLRAGVTRSPVTPSVARTRPDPGWLFCDSFDTGTLDGGAQTELASIPVSVDESYQRVFLSAAVHGLQTFTGSE